MRLITNPVFILIFSVGFFRAQQMIPPVGDTKPAPVPVQTAVKVPVLLNSPDLIFPLEALQLNKNGRCAIAFIIDKEGVPQHVHAIRCTDIAFKEASLDTASKFRFKPAEDKNGHPIPYPFTWPILFRATRGEIVTKNFYQLYITAPPGTVSKHPDEKGVYPLSDLVTEPTLSKFIDEGYSQMAFDFDDTSPCDVLATIDRKGKVTDLRILHCLRKTLEEPISKTLLNSRFKPGIYEGHPVPVRVLIHMEFGGLVVDR